MQSKIRLLFWYLINFRYSPQLLILFIHFFTKKYTKPNQKLFDWLNSNKVELNDFFSQLKFDAEDFYEAQKKYIIRGNEIEKNNTIKLGGRGHLNLIYNMVLYLKPKIVLETGVAYGWSSLAILTAFKNCQNQSLISIDMRYPLLKDYTSIRGAVVEDKKNWIFIDAIDIYGINLADKKSQNQKYGFIHYDSDKTYFGRYISYKRLWKRLENNGYLLSDDISDNMAFYDFCKKLNLTPKIFKINNRYTGLLKKKYSF